MAEKKPIDRGGHYEALGCADCAKKNERIRQLEGYMSLNLKEFMRAVQDALTYWDRSLKQEARIKKAELVMRYIKHKLRTEKTIKADLIRNMIDAYEREYKELGD